MGLLDQLSSFAQGASNGVASNISAPVDGLAWLLRKAGVPMPSNPMGGSDWMAERSLTPQPQNRIAGLLGEGIGGVLPGVAAAKAPQIAKGLLQGADNLVAPMSMNPQAGAIYFGKDNPLKRFSGSLSNQRERDIAYRQSEIIRDWQNSGGSASDEIFGRLRNKPNVFDKDGDLTDVGSAMYSKYEDRLSAQIARQEIGQLKINLTDPSIASEYAKRYAEKHGIPVFAVGGSSKSGSRYLPLGSNISGEGQTIRFSDHVLPDTYQNNAAFEFGNFDGGVKDTAKLRAYIRSLKPISND